MNKNFGKTKLLQYDNAPTNVVSAVDHSVMSTHTAPDYNILDHERFDADKIEHRKALKKGLSKLDKPQVTLSCQERFFIEDMIGHYPDTLFKTDKNKAEGHVVNIRNTPLGKQLYNKIYKTLKNESRGFSRFGRSKNRREKGLPLQDGVKVVESEYYGLYVVLDTTTWKRDWDAYSFSKPAYFRKGEYGFEDGNY